MIVTSKVKQNIGILKKVHLEQACKQWVIVILLGEKIY